MEKIDRNARVGQKFGLLTVIRRAPDYVSYGGKKEPADNPRRVVERYYCACQCGTKDILVELPDLLYAGVTSCGCWKNASHAKNFAYAIRKRQQMKKAKAEFVRKYPLLKKFLAQ